MFRPPTLHSDLPTEALLIEDIPPHATEVEKFVNGLNPKTPVQKIGLAATTGNFILYPLLFANFMRIFWEVQSILKTELDHNLYYRCEILPDVRTAISFDGATLRAEGAGLTTTSAGIGALIALIAAQYQLVRYCARQKQFSHASNINHCVNTFIKSLLLDNPEHENKVRAFLLDVPLDKLTALLNTDRNKKGLNAEVMNEITCLGSTWEKFADDLAWYRGEVNTSYLVPIMGLSTIPAFVITFIAALNLSRESSCSTFPLLAYLSDTCDVSEQYKNLSLLTYFWDVLSVTGLSVYCGVLLARFATASPSLQFTRTWFYENVHQRYFQYDPDKWVYRKLIWRLASYVFAPAIIAYSFVEALHLANSYLDEMNCPSMGDLIWAIYSNNHEYDAHCPSSEKSMAIAGFLGDFELVKVDFLLIAVTFFSYLSVMIYEYCKRHAARNEDNFQFAKKLLAKLDNISNISWDFAIGACVIIGILQFFPIKKFADDILHHDLEIFYKDTFIFPANNSDITNDTIPQMLSQFCPYDNLTAIMLDAANTTHFNLTDFITTNIPFKIIDNTTLAFINAPACPQQEMASVYFHNIAGLNSTCDPLLETRAIGGFVGPYWLGISFVSGGVYIVATTTQLLLWGINSFKKCLTRKNEENKVVEETEDEIENPYSLLPMNGAESPKSPYRGAFFTRKPMPVHTSRNNTSKQNHTISMPKPI